MKLHDILLAVLVTLFSSQVYAIELPDEAQKMLDDLGQPDLQQQNNGKLFRCVHGGTKRVTVSQLGDAAIFTADYSNCREPGSTRDGHYKIMLRNNEIIGRSSKRSINGELFDAVRVNNVARVKKLIGRKADVNYSESISTDADVYIDEWTPLMWAAFNGNVKMIRLLVKAGGWVNYLNSDVVNAVWLASRNGHFQAVRELVRNGAYVNNRNRENVTPLMMASMYGHYSVVKYLIDAKADINMVHKDGDGDSALMFALGARKNRVAKLLIDSGADIDIHNKFGVTALMIAAAEGNEEAVRMLLDKGADVNVKSAGGITAHDIAAGKGFSEIAGLLAKAAQKATVGGR
jgi:ankyrin repeat protein